MVGTYQYLSSQNKINVLHRRTLLAVAPPPPAPRLEVDDLTRCDNV